MQDFQLNLRDGVIVSHEKNPNFLFLVLVTNSMCYLIWHGNDTCKPKLYLGIYSKRTSQSYDYSFFGVIINSNDFSHLGMWDLIHHYHVGCLLQVTALICLVSLSEDDMDQDLAQLKSHISGRD